MSHIDIHYFFHILGTMTLAPKEALMEIIKKRLCYVLLLMSQGFYIWHGLQINRTINRLRTSNRGTFWGWIDSQVIASSIVPAPPKKIQFILNIAKYSTNENKLEITNTYETNICLCLFGQSLYAFPSSCLITVSALMLIAAPGFYFSIWVFGWGSIQKIP